ncbi:hypothetical protein CR51_36270 [Caballeronia megalochromosomata]|nr:hypothetical protein CR51_36270 [Caballeronia megalochromosomata]
MPLESPDLDDRSFDDLVDEATRRVRLACPAWTDLGASDPGIVLLEAFAFLTHGMMRSFNRMPARAYVEFLRLIDVHRMPPRAARVKLRFSIQQPAAGPVAIPMHTRVTVGRGGADQPAPVFMTVEAAQIAAGATSVDVMALQAEWIAAEPAGTGSGEPRQTVRLHSPPVIAPVAGFDALIVGIAEPSLAPSERAGYRSHGNRMYRLCREVARFMDDDTAGGCAFKIDRVSGLITFAPSLGARRADAGTPPRVEHVAEVPAAGMDILVWYARGGGPEGNVAAGSLTVLKDVIPGVSVTNPERATGGVAAETVENALLRGPQSLHSLERAVTARDFEMLAERHAGASRAKAFTQADMWEHAVPGTVKILLVPAWPESLSRSDASVSAKRLEEQESAASLAEIDASFNDLKPLGTRCEAGWVRYKTVSVQADVRVYRGEDPEAVKARVLKNLHEAINPLPVSRKRRGWPFGEPLRVSHVYDLILSEKSVSYVEKVRLVVDDVPDRNVLAIAADLHQPQTWYAGANDTLFRSMNDGNSWERVASLDASATLVAPHPGCKGWLAVVSRADKTSKVHFSRDCGETWQPATASFGLAIEDIAWLTRSDGEVLLIATTQGLYELSLTAPAPTPVQIVVDPAIEALGINAITVFTDVRGAVNVAVSAQRNRGVFLSTDAGKPGSFVPIGLNEENVRTLAVQKIGPRSFIWAGSAIPGNEAGKGLHRWEATGSTQSSDGWRQYGKDWSGGSCNSIAFDGGIVYAATHHSGVVKLDSEAQDPGWTTRSLRSRLPARDQAGGEDKRIFLPVSAVATMPTAAFVLAGGEEGVYRTDDGGATYENVSLHAIGDRITLPRTWLLCSGAHDIKVQMEDESGKD